MITNYRHQTGDGTPQELPPRVLGILMTLKDVAMSYGHKRSPAKEQAWGVFIGYVAALKQAGWRNSVLTEALGVSREAIRQLEIKYQEHVVEPEDDWPVPWAPRRLPRWGYGPAEAPFAHRRKFLTDAEREELTRLRLLSTNNRGPTYYLGADDVPEVQAGILFARMLAAKIAEGHSEYGLAADLGITTLAVHQRLARHGYVDFYPSQHKQYGMRSSVAPKGSPRGREGEETGKEGESN